MVKLFCDMHVHLYDQTKARQRIERTAQIVQSRYPNLNGMVIVVTKSAKEDFFDPTQKSGFLRNTGLETPPFPIYLFYAYQVVTQENLEVHIYGEHPFKDRAASLHQILSWCQAQNCCAALPWGMGKWSLSRKALVAEALATFSPPIVDSALRCIPSKEFCEAARKHTKVLYGSDPLPLPHDDERIATLGSLYEADQLPTNAHQLIQGCSSNTPLGNYTPTGSCIALQIRLRLPRW